MVLGKHARRAIKYDLPGACEVCGYDVFVQHHRILPGKAGGEYLASNIAVLCGNDHFRADRGLDDPDDPRWLAPEDLRAIVDRRLKRQGRP